MRLLRIFLKRYLRYAEYLIAYVLFEKPRGLDFSMRAKSKVTAKGSTGYALTSKKAIFNILRNLPITSEDSFIDIGSGKGGVPCFVSEKSFGRVAGIEYESWLHNIATKNIEILDLQDRVELINADARYFEGYSDFNYFFFFNPFDDEIYAEVISNIVSSFENKQKNERPKWLLCYGKANIQSIEETNYFELVRRDVCPYRENDINIYKSKSTRPVATVFPSQYGR